MYLYQYFLGNHESLGWAEIRSLKLYARPKITNQLFEATSIDVKELKNYFTGELLNYMQSKEIDMFIRFLRSFHKKFADKKIFSSILVLSNKKESQMHDMLATMGGPTKVAKIVGIKYISVDKKSFLQEVLHFIKKILIDTHKQNTLNLKYTRLNWYTPEFNFDLDYKYVRTFLSNSLNITVKLVGDPKQKISNTATTHKVLKNNGIELNITYEKQTGLLVVSKTFAVQNYKVFSDLEYNRPHRDMEIGMLPFKLSLIMLNLAQLKQNMGFWDPMVGLGTLLMAGQLKGLYSYGSDNDHIAVKKAKENVEWLFKKGLVQQLKFRTFRFDITKNPMSNKILRDIARYGKFDAIVTEGYLGPTRRKPFTSKRQVAVWISKLNNLYSKFLRNVSPLLQQGRRVVFCTPIYKYYDNGQIKKVALAAPINKNRYKVVSFDTGPLIWENKRSVVARQVHVIEKK